jgi:hypothetical protein
MDWASSDYAVKCLPSIRSSITYTESKVEHGRFYIDCAPTCFFPFTFKADSQAVFFLCRVVLTPHFLSHDGIY